MISRTEGSQFRAPPDADCPPHYPCHPDGIRIRKDLNCGRQELVIKRSTSAERIAHGNNVIVGSHWPSASDQASEQILHGAEPSARCAGYYLIRQAGACHLPQGGRH